MDSRAPSSVAHSSYDAPSVANNVDPHAKSEAQGITEKDIKEANMLTTMFYLDEAVTAELRQLYGALQKCLDLRAKYMFRSRQRLEDDPRNRDDWKIYPPPPPPSWPLPSPEELARRKKMEEARQANPVEAVGSDFIWEECEIPGGHEVKRKDCQDRDSVTYGDVVRIWHRPRRILPSLSK